jgi:DNA-binding transcriptional ArsR family regulator
VAERQAGILRRHRVAGQEPGKSAAAPGSPAAGIDTLIHERTRLGIVSALAARDRISFTELKAILGATDGNVSAHARKLEDAGYIEASKRFEGRMPRTEYSLTPAGRAAFERYLQHMENLIRAVPRS